VTGKRSRLEEWLASNTLPAVSIAGALVYGIIRISYVGFYGEFGLDPEDVGIGYAATLARALPGLLFWFAVLGLWLLAYYAVVVWRHGVEAPERVSRLRRYIVWGLAGGFLLMFLVSAGDAQRAAAAVKRGDELRAPSALISWGIVRDPLGFTVREVNVEWVDGDASAHTKLGRPLMLLGNDSDVYYLYDVQFKRTVRLPRSLVIVTEDIG
jgi:hypothetical protein